MPITGSNSITTCSGKIFDSGANGNYANNSSGTMLITPNSSGSKVRLSFSSSFFLENNKDFLRIYDGSGRSANLIGSYTGGNSPGTITATTTAGTLFLEFSSNAQNFYSGFEASISCTSPPCNPGRIVSSLSFLCNDDTSRLSLRNFSSSSSIQWQGSRTGDIWNNLNGEKDSILLVKGSSAYTQFRAVSICGGSNSGFSVSNPIQITNYSFGVSANDTVLCNPDSVELNATIFGLINEIKEDFDPIDNSLWNKNTGFTGGSGSSRYCRSKSGDALQMRSNDASRVLESVPLDLRAGGEIDYSLNIGFGTICAAVGSSSNEWVYFQYSTNNGKSWTNLGSYPGSLNWRDYSVKIPAAARTPNTILRWYQPSNSGACCDHWGIDNITIPAASSGNISFQWIPKNLYSNDTTQRNSRYFDSTSIATVIYTDNDSGCVDTSRLEIIIPFLNPQIDVPDTIVIGDSVRIKNLTQVGADSLQYEWTFNNIDTINSRDAEYLFESEDTVGVKLKMTSMGCSKSLNKEVKALKKPIINFQVNNTCQGDSVFFVNTTNKPELVDSFIWFFGDGNRSNKTSPHHVYKSPGQYTITLIAKRNRGFSDTITQRITQFSVPQPALNINKACLGDPLILNDRSTISGGNISLINLDFNKDGVFDTFNLRPGFQVKRDYLSAGTKTIIVDAVASNGCRKVDTVYSDIFPVPSAKFDYNKACSGDSFDIVDNSFISSNKLDSTYYDLNGDNLYDTVMKSGNTLTLIMARNETVITQKAVSTDGCQDIYRGLVQPKNTPKASFFLSNACVDQNTIFFGNSDTAKTNVDSISWYFGTNNSPYTTFKKTGKSFSRVFNRSGAHLVKKEIVLSNGCKDSVVQNIIVNPVPVIDFSFSEACEGNATFFQDSTSIEFGSIDNVRYDLNNDKLFEQDGLAAGAIFKHVYTSSGVKAINIEATSSKGCTTQMGSSLNYSGTVTVNPNPNPFFKSDTVCLGALSSIIDSSYISSGSVDSISYDLDGDRVYDTTLFSPYDTLQWEFDEAGKHIVSAIAYSDKGCINIFSDSVFVLASPKPKIEILKACKNSISTLQVFKKQKISYRSISIDFNGDGSIDSLNFHFGDTLKYDFGNINSSTVVVNAESNDGCKSIESKTIIVNDKPSVRFKNSNACKNQNILFSNRSRIDNGQIVEYQWDFGDGGKSYKKNETYNYDSLTNFIVSLVGISDKNCSDTFSKNIEVNEAPIAAFDINNLCYGDSTRFVSRSKGTDIDSTIWDFGDGNSSIQENPSHQYRLASTFRVKLFVANKYSCYDSTSQAVSLKQSPILRFVVDDFCERNTPKIQNNTLYADSFVWITGSQDSFFKINDIKFKSPDSSRLQLLAINTQNGCSKLGSEDFLIFRKPVISFVTSGSCNNQPLNIRNTSSKKYSSQWYLNDSLVENSWQPNLFHPKADSIRIKLVSETRQGCTDSLESHIRVNQSPKVIFNLNEVCLYDSVFFNNIGDSTSIQYQWSFGDSTYSTAFNATHKYNLASTFNVTLLGIDTLTRCRDSAFKSIDIHPLPKSKFRVIDTCLGDSFKTVNTTQNKISNVYTWLYNSNAFINRDISLMNSSVGKRSISLIAQNRFGCVDTASRSFSIVPSPDATFYLKDSCLNTTIEFGLTNPGNMRNYNWNFGDGKRSNKESPLHRYNVSGNYTVKLAITNQYGCSDDKSGNFSIYEAPNSNFYSSDLCLHDSLSLINFSDNAVRYDWLIDGAIYSSYEPSHKFSSPGKKKIQLISSSAKFCTDTLDRQITVFPGPRISTNYSSSCINDTARFSASSLPNSNFEWIFPEELNYSLKGSAIAMKFSSPGLKSFLAIGTNKEGCSDTAQGAFRIYPAPKSNLMTPEEICINESVRFRQLNPLVDSTIWCFSEFGKCKKGNSVQFSFSNAKSFSWNVILKDSNGCTSIEEGDLKVYKKPTSIFQLPNFCESDLVEPSNLSTGEIVKYTWLVAGNEYLGFEPEIKIQNPGSHNASLITESANGCYDTASMKIKVFHKPSPSFENSLACLGDSVKFWSTSNLKQGTIIGYNWDFGNGLKASGPNVSGQYLIPGKYPVTLELESDKMCKNAIEDSIEVFEKPKISLSMNDVCLGDSTELNLKFDDKEPFKLIYWDLDDGTYTSNNIQKYLYTEVGTYTPSVRVFNKFGCSDSATGSMNIKTKPKANFVAEDVCFTEVSSFRNTSFDGDDYNWRFGDGFGSSSLKNVNYKFFNPGNYNVTLTVINDNNCLDSAQKIYQVYPNPTANFFVNPICANESLQLKKLMTNTNLSTQWRLRDSLIQDSILATIDLTPGEYPITLLVTDSNNCLDSVERTLRIDPLPSFKITGDSIIHLGETAHLKIPSDLRAVWQNNDDFIETSSFEAKVKPEETSRYAVEGFNQFDCSHTDTFDVKVLEEYVLKINNLITPDGNQQNDSWIVENIDSYTDITVTIFSKEGRVVYQSSNYKNNWMGTDAQGNALPDGVYFYLINCNDGERIYKGDINILKNHKK